MALKIVFPNKHGGKTLVQVKLLRNFIFYTWKDQRTHEDSTPHSTYYLANILKYYLWVVLNSTNFFTHCIQFLVGRARSNLSSNGHVDGLSQTCCIRAPWFGWLKNGPGCDITHGLAWITQALTPGVKQLHDWQWALSSFLNCVCFITQTSVIWTVNAAFDVVTFYHKVSHHYLNVVNINQNTREHHQ